MFEFWQRPRTGVCGMSWIDGVWGLQGKSWPQETGVCVACLPLPSHHGSGPTQNNLGRCPWAEVTVENCVTPVLEHVMLSWGGVEGQGGCCHQWLTHLSLKEIFVFIFW